MGGHIFAVSMKENEDGLGGFFSLVTEVPPVELGSIETLKPDILGMKAKLFGGVKEFSTWVIKKAATSLGKQAKSQQNKYFF